VPGQEIPAAPEVLAWLQFVAVVLTGGLLTVRALVSAPAARMVGTSPRADAPAAIGIGVAGAALGLHAGILAFLTGAYPIVGGGLLNFVDTLVEPIRAGTHLGQAWTVMTFAWFGVLALLVAAWVTPPRREPLLGAAGLLALAIAFGISWVSHPASRGALALLADYAHLLTGALWVGGLLAVVILAGFARPLPRPAGEEIARTCMVRFSNLAVPVVVLLGAAGMYLALRDLPAPSALISSRYGLTLLLKSGAAVGALGLGGYHRLRVVPRLAAGAPVATIRRTLLLETSLLVLALGFAAVLTQTAPPR
jgi:putative copper export protein